RCSRRISSCCVMPSGTFRMMVPSGMRTSGIALLRQIAEVDDAACRLRARTGLFRRFLAAKAGNQILDPVAALDLEAVDVGLIQGDLQPVGQSLTVGLRRLADRQVLAQGDLHFAVRNGAREDLEVLEAKPGRDRVEALDLARDAPRVGTVAAENVLRQ